MDHGASDEDNGVRAYSLSALALRGGGQSEEILRRERRNPDPDARIVAIQSIAERDPASVLVRLALADEDPGVCRVRAGPDRRGRAEGGAPDRLGPLREQEHRET